VPLRQGIVRSGRRLDQGRQVSVRDADVASCELAEAMVRKRKEALAREHPVRAFTRVSSNEMFDFCGCAGFGVSLLFGCIPAGWHPTVEAEVRVGTDCGSGLLFCGAGRVNEVWSEFFL